MTETDSVLTIVGVGAVLMTSGLFITALWNRAREGKARVDYTKMVVVVDEKEELIAAGKVSVSVIAKRTTWRRKEWIGTVRDFGDGARLPVQLVTRRNVRPERVFDLAVRSVLGRLLEIR